jgi:hypothetical protein
MAKSEENLEQADSQPKPPADRLTVILRWVLGIIGGAAILIGAWYAYAYLVTPAAVRQPEYAHYHFRMQVINAGQPVDFSGEKFQTAFNKGICTADLTQEPFHFHDNLNQFVHVHWDQLTGGLLLKNYGWNLVGGTENTLGYRFDQLPKLARVPVHGRDLPAPPAGSKYYIYTGDETGYVQRDWGSFLREDLRTFFSGKSASKGFWYGLVPTASAHDGHDGHDPEELKQLNDVLGSVVIFAQLDAPSDAQIKERFNQLVPLPESTCGG